MSDESCERAMERDEKEMTSCVKCTDIHNCFGASCLANFQLAALLEVDDIVGFLNTIVASGAACCRHGRIVQLDRFYFLIGLL